MPDWEAKYRGAAPHLYGPGPNAYVRSLATRSGFHARSALCLADGDGRNGRFLAGLGLAVTALDLSQVATERALALDRAERLAVERFAADISRWQPPADARWDMVILIYLQGDAAERAAAYRIARDAVAPGGLVAIEGFANPRSEQAPLGPKDRAVRYDLDEVAAAFQGFDVIEALSGRILLDEGDMHQGLAQVVRFAAKRPA